MLRTPIRYEIKPRFSEDTGERLAPKRQQVGGDMEYIRLKDGMTLSEMGLLSEQDLLAASDHGDEGNWGFAEEVNRSFAREEVMYVEVQQDSNSGTTRLLIGPNVRMKTDNYSRNVVYMHDSARELLVVAEKAHERAVAMGLLDVSQPLITTSVY